MRRIARGKKPTHSFRFSIGAEHLENVLADESPRFGGIMRRARNAHGADGRAGKSFGSSVSRGAAHGAAFAMKRSPGAPPQQDIRMLFIKSAAPIPRP